MKVFLLATSALFVSLLSAVGGEVIFSDDFDRDSSADWIVIEDSLNNTPDATVIFGHDYSEDSFKVTRGATTETLTVPKNPFDLGETTVALKVFVNSDEEAAEASVSLFPRNFDVQGDHSLRFEMFMSYNGPAFGGSGSTEFVTMGVGHSGELVASLDGKAALRATSERMLAMVSPIPSFWMNKMPGSVSRIWTVTGLANTTPSSVVHSSVFFLFLPTKLKAPRERDGSKLR